MIEKYKDMICNTLNSIEVRTKWSWNQCSDSFIPVTIKDSRLLIPKIYFKFDGQNQLDILESNSDPTVRP